MLYIAFAFLVACADGTSQHHFTASSFKTNRYSLFATATSPVNICPRKREVRICVAIYQIPTDRIAENAVHDGQTLLYRLFVVVIFNRGFHSFQIGTIRIDFPVINALFLEIFLKGLVSKHDTDGTDFTHIGKR